MITQTNDLKHSLERLINKTPEVIHENANKDANVFNTLRDLTAGTVAKSLGLEMLPAHIRDAHVNGDIHFHDLDYHPYMPMTNCCLIDIPYMLSHGFKIGNAHVDSPKSIQTATAQIAQIIANVASSQYGGCSVDRIDEVLSPYAALNAEKHQSIAQQFIADDKREAYIRQMTEKDIGDAIQSLEYEINTLYTSNGQTPFVTFGFGLGMDEYSVMIQRAILNTRLQGLGTTGATAIFPKLVFSLKDGVNLKITDPNYKIKQLAIQCATKRMYPDVLNYQALTDMIGDFKAPMGCRSFLNAYKENGEFINNGRFNLGVVTLNLPRIAMLKSTPDAFMQELKERLDLLRDACLFRIERLKEAQPQNAPILYQHGAFGKKLNADDDISVLFTGCRSTISMGYIGLYEVGAHLFSKDWEQDKTAYRFVLSILKTMKAYADDLTKNYDIQFSIYGTPSESLTDRFCRIDFERFGPVPNVTDKGYYTNSFHYDIRKKVTPFEKIDFEKDFALYSTGGFIHYCEYPTLTHNPEALETVWDYAYSRVGYLGTNTPIDQCYECGFSGEFEASAVGFKCPHCGNHNPDTTDVVKRTCGYLGQPLKRPMVQGRHKEIKTRVKHMSVRDDLL